MTKLLPGNGPPSSKSLRGQTWALIALLSLATLAVFWGALKAEFVQWDDDINIYRNPHIRGLTAENLHWMLTDVAYVRRYLPLTWLGWGLHYEWGRLNPLGYHLGNVVLHCLNSVLVFLLISKLLLLGSTNETSEKRRTQVLWCSAIGALLWAVHPLRVEPVAWASGRIYCQAIFFLLLSLLGYLRFATSPAQAKGRTVFYWLSIVAFAASLLTYPLALGYLVVLIVLDFYPLKRFPGGPASWWKAESRRIWLEKVPFVTVIGLVFAVTLWARVHASGVWQSSVTLKEFGVGPRILQAFYIWNYYAWKPLAPVDLSPVYTTLVWINPADWRFDLSVLEVVALSAILIWKRQRWPMVLALWICHSALLVPMLGLTEHPHYPSDRYSYLVSVLWSVLIAAGLLKFWGEKKRRTLGPAAALTVAVLLGVLSAKQVLVWHDSITLFQHVITKLGNNPYRADIHSRLGEVLARQGDLEGALAHYTTSLNILPNFAEAHLQTGALLNALGRKKQALTHIQEAARLRPDSEIVQNQAGIVLAEQGSVKEAIEHYREALRLKPDFPDPLNNLAWALATAPDPALRNGSEAVRLAERACELTRRQVPNPLGTLAAAYAEAGRFKEAIETAQKAAALALSQGDKELAARNQHLLALYRTGQAYHEPPKTEQ